MDVAVVLEALSWILEVAILVFFEPEVPMFERESGVGLALI